MAGSWCFVTGSAQKAPGNVTTHVTVWILDTYKKVVEKDVVGRRSVQISERRTGHGRGMLSCLYM